MFQKIKQIFKKQPDPFQDPALSAEEIRREMEALEKVELDIRGAKHKQSLARTINDKCQELADVGLWTERRRDVRAKLLVSVSDYIELLNSAKMIINPEQDLIYHSPNGSIIISKSEKLEPGKVEYQLEVLNPPPKIP